jgi:hypothetical protein
MSRFVAVLVVVLAGLAGCELHDETPRTCTATESFLAVPPPPSCREDGPVAGAAAETVEYVLDAGRIGWQVCTWSCPYPEHNPMRVCSWELQLDGTWAGPVCYGTPCRL